MQDEVTNHDLLDHVPSAVKGAVDIASFGVVVGTLFNHLPSIAALFTIIWTGIRIWETDTVRGWTGRPLKHSGD